MLGYKIQDQKNINWYIYPNINSNKLTKLVVFSEKLKGIL